MTEILYMYKDQEVKTEPSKLHTVAAHEFWVKRNGVCPYCQNGSVPVSKKVIVERLEKR